MVLEGDLQGQEAYRKKTNVPRSSRSDLPNGGREPHVRSCIHGVTSHARVDVSQRTISPWSTRFGWADRLWVGIHEVEEVSLYNFCFLLFRWNTAKDNPPGLPRNTKCLNSA